MVGLLSGARKHLGEGSCLFVALTDNQHFWPTFPTQNWSPKAFSQLKNMPNRAASRKKIDTMRGFFGIPIASRFFWSWQVSSILWWALSTLRARNSILTTALCTWYIGNTLRQSTRFRRTQWPIHIMKPGVLWRAPGRHLGLPKERVLMFFLRFVLYFSCAPNHLCHAIAYTMEHWTGVGFETGVRFLSEYRVFRLVCAPKGPHGFVVIASLFSLFPRFPPDFREFLALKFKTVIPILTGAGLSIVAGTVALGAGATGPSCGIQNRNRLPFLNFQSYAADFLLRKSIHHIYTLHSDLKKAFISIGNFRLFEHIFLRHAPAHVTPPPRIKGPPRRTILSDLPGWAHTQARGLISLLLCLVIIQWALNRTSVWWPGGWALNWGRVFTSNVFVPLPSFALTPVPQPMGRMGVAGGSLERGGGYSAQPIHPFPSIHS